MKKEVKTMTHKYTITFHPGPPRKIPPGVEEFIRGYRTESDMGCSYEDKSVIVHPMISGGINGWKKHIKDLFPRYKHVFIEV